MGSAVLIANPAWSTSVERGYVNPVMFGQIGMITSQFDPERYAVRVAHSGQVSSQVIHRNWLTPAGTEPTVEMPF